jgi:uncharacterized iron-regulated protein
VASTAVQKLRVLQKSLYDKAYEDAHSIVGTASLRLLNYSKQFEESLPKSFEASTLTEILEGLKKKRFLMYGDFHTLRQSQRGLLRLLRSYCEKQRTNKVVIALEMFKAIDQDDIDGYLAGAIPESEFLEGVNYAADWGFPWQNFKMILDFARARKLRVIGINSDNGGRDDLASRDRFAARRLVQAAKEHPDHKILILIGEHHLGDAHLPRSLAKEAKAAGLPAADLIRVLNNVDRYYFDLQREASHNTTEYLRLKKDFYCIMNSPPWMKWQSFSIWEEMRSAGIPQIADQEGELDSDIDLYTEDAFDVDYQFLHFLKNLSVFLGFRIDSSDLESFRIHFSQDGDFFNDDTGLAETPERESRRILERVTIDGVHFIPHSKTVLLTHLSINNLAEAAGQYLYTLMSGFDDNGGSPEGDFFRRILKGAIGMLASKILNPRRKCMELHHHKQYIRRFKGQRLTGAAHARRHVANAVLKFDRWIEDRLQDATPPLLPRTLVIADNRVNYEISREIGQMLGATIYKKVIANKLPSSRLPRLFKKRLPHDVALWKEVTALYKLLKA